MQKFQFQVQLHIFKWEIEKSDLISVDRWNLILLFAFCGPWL